MAVKQLDVAIWLSSQLLKSSPSPCLLSIISSEYDLCKIWINESKMASAPSLSFLSVLKKSKESKEEERIVSNFGKMPAEC